MENWRGHLPITCMALFSIVGKAANEDSEFSLEEWILFTACEFWAAVSSGELRAHLDAKPADGLRSAGLAMASCGAERIARSIFAALDELRNTNTHQGRDAFIARLEIDLQGTQDPMDALLGQMAQRCIAGSPLGGRVAAVSPTTSHRRPPP